MGTPGLAGLDKMISYFIAVEMENTVKYINQGVKGKMWAGMLKECESICQAVDSKSKYSVSEYKLPIRILYFQNSRLKFRIYPIE